ncbi:cytochrome P450 [Emericellopsis atlantica]|uniref:Cytochrome P450 n=1 Tax=Emericellopsis atlantica TaxID=2614577 RepID=A0A9P8CLY1_9HYPO|nr:cytochrome P450 [Emericellopsis atlantica]KAG9251502.1 cytochrome P450 [Emericellopsis atlantica]
MMEAVSRPAIAGPLLLIVAWAVYQLFFKPSALPDLPIVGARPGDWSPMWQARLRNFKDMKAALNSSYAQYQNQATILPLLDSGNIVLLPQSDTKFLADQPDNVLNMHDQAQDSLQTDYTTMDPSLTHDPIHTNIIVGTLTKEIANLVPGLAEEIAYCFDRHLGADPEFKEIGVYDSMQHVLSGVTNRALVGFPLCREQKVLDMGIAFAQDIPLSSMLMRCFPGFAKPLVAPLITLPNRIHTRKFEKLLAPEIETRLQQCGLRQGVQASEKSDVPRRNDFLQWSIEQAKAIGNPKNWRVSALAQRVLLLNFAAIHTSTFAMTHVLLDLASAPPEIIEELREEAANMLKEHDGQWSKRGLAQLEKLDSAMRESQRKNSFVGLGLMRKVVAQDGVTFPSGVHVRQGNSVCVPAYSVLQDSAVYTDPKTYKPFRFYEARVSETEGYVKRARNAFPTASPDFLGWGLGRNACPGRFFASNEIKMMLAYLLLHYDIEHQESRPRNVWFGMNRIPPMKATLRMRKRATA